MDLSKVNAHNVNKFSVLQINRILQTIFTAEEWSSMGRLDRVHHRFIFTSYFQKECYRQTYTLEQFLRIKRDLFKLQPSESSIIPLPIASSSSSNLGFFTNPSTSSSTETSCSNDYSFTGPNTGSQSSDDDDSMPSTSNKRKRFD